MENKLGRYTNKSSLKTRRCLLRVTNKTPSEIVLWYKLRNKQTGYKFRRQFSISNFIVDFYCHELKLVIEIDGINHSDPEQTDYDKFRQKFLEKNGYRVIRYRNEQVLNELGGVVHDILNKIDCFLRQTPPRLP